MTTHQPRQDIDLVRFEQNRRRIPRDVLVPYAGQYVAFSADGTHVVAHGPDRDTAAASVRDLGLGIGEVVWEWIPALDEDTWL